MSAVLVLHAHPSPSRSNHNRPMFERAAGLDGVTAVDLYASYPRFRIDVAAEQQRLIDHDAVVLQFPFYWYSVPALLKEYLDRVLGHGFAYGEGGDRLHGKTLLAALTAGGAESAYASDGSNGFDIHTLLTPLRQTARLCGMHWAQPLVLFGAHEADGDQRGAHTERFVASLQALVTGRPGPLDGAGSRSGRRGGRRGGDGHGGQAARGDAGARS